MTSTHTPKPAQQRQRPAPTRRTTQERFRGPVSAIAMLTIIGGAFYLAFSLGNDKQIKVSIGVEILGLALAFASQTSWLYAWADRPARTNDSGPVVAHADAAPTRPPRQRNRHRNQVEVPSIKPAGELGAEFGYTIMFGRHVAAENDTNTFNILSKFWGGNTDEYAGDDDAFAEVIADLYELLVQYPGYDEDVTPQQLLAGNIDRANPFPFVAELEAYHPMLAAFAVLMLLHKHPKVDREDFDTVMEPWTGMGFPYRLADMIFKVGADGQYHAKQAPTRMPATPTPRPPSQGGIIRPQGTLDEAFAALTDAEASPAPSHAPSPAPPAAYQPPAPAAAPAPATDEAVDRAAEPIRRAEPDRDDVGEPDTEQILKAAELIIDSQFGSIPMLQRKLRIGFILATKIVHRLHVYGVVGSKPGDGGAREVMVPTEELAEQLDLIREWEAERRHRG